MCQVFFIWHAVNPYGKLGYLHFSLIFECFAIVLKSVNYTFFNPLHLMIYTRKQLPKYCRHRPSGRAYVRIEGKMYYLGKYGSDARRREYDRIIAEFVANSRRTHRNPDEIRIDALITQYLNYIDREVDFSRSRKASIIRILRRLNAL